MIDDFLIDKVFTPLTKITSGVNFARFFLTGMLMFSSTVLVVHPTAMVLFWYFCVVGLAVMRFAMCDLLEKKALKEDLRKTGRFFRSMLLSGFCWMCLIVMTTHTVSFLGTMCFLVLLTYTLASYFIATPTK